MFRPITLPYVLTAVVFFAVGACVLLYGHLIQYEVSLGAFRIIQVESAITPMSVFQQRRQHYTDTCIQGGSSRLSTMRADRRRAPFMRVGHMVMCPVPKTGTTLWKQILFYVSSNQTSPFFEVEFLDVHKQMNKQGKPIRQVLDGKVMTSVFVREPYSRLFSAYVDKLFKPLETNWLDYGLHIVKYVHRKPTAGINHTCAGDITFAEFVRYFIDSETKRGPLLRRNIHYMPQSQLCGFCKSVDKSREEHDLGVTSHAKTREDMIDGAPDEDDVIVDEASGSKGASVRSGFLVYDFIGKTETIIADTNAILQASGLDKKLPSSFDMRSESPKHTITGIVVRVFRDITNKSGKAVLCMSKEERLRRIWKHFQMRGMISKHELFPLTSSETNDVSMEDMLELAIAAFDRSTSDPELKGSKKAAMAEAYSTVPLKNRQALKRIYADDFELFQYPPSIPEVFPVNDKFRFDSYHFLDIFDESNKPRP